MYRKIGLVAAACFAFCLCFALAGCGANNKAGFVGDWDIESGSDENLNASSIELMKSLGLNITIALKEDGSGTMNLFGERTDITWEATSASEGKMTVQSSETKIKLADGKLILENSDGSSMTFAKSDGSATSASHASASSAASASGSASSEAASSASAEASSASAAASSASASASSEAASASAEAVSNESENAESGSEASKDENADENTQNEEAASENGTAE